jgi:hypothetical protein
LNQLATDAMAYKLFYNQSEDPGGSEFDLELTPNDIRHIIFTEAMRTQGSGLTFRADEAEAFDADWPMALRRPEFDSARAEFQAARDEAIRELREEGSMSYSNWRRLQLALDTLSDVFNEVYGRENVKTSTEFLRFRKPAENFLKAQAVGVYRAMVTNNLDVFRGDYRFDGDSVVELIQHACQHGLQFAPCQPGDEPTYRRLLIAMRQLYLHYYPQSESASSSR